MLKIRNIEMMEEPAEWNDGVETPVGSTASAAIVRCCDLSTFQSSGVPAFCLDFRLVNVAPTPVLPGFERLNDRVRA
jgi:hypothetical protein